MAEVDTLAPPHVPSSPEVPRSRLLGWLVLVSSLATLAYAANLSDPGDPRNDLLYLWSTAAAGALTYAVIFGILLLLCRGIAPATLGLRRPDSWRRALLLVVAGFVAITIVGNILDQFLNAGEEQGLLPDGWDASRAVPFFANVVVVAGIAPVVEELSFRGLGFASVRSAWGVAAAIVVTSLAFGLAHGLVEALPVLTLFGLVLAVVRLRTDSLYPSILLHAVFNALALLVAVTIGGSS